MREQGGSVSEGGMHLLYYPVVGRSFAIAIDMHYREVILWGGESYYDNRKALKLPDHIREEEDAKEWALAIWRLEL